MSQMEMKINVNISILPFGQSVIKIRSSEATGEKKATPATYTEPKTTDANIVEINLDGNNYTTPKTTAGLL